MGVAATLPELSEWTLLTLTLPRTLIPLSHQKLNCFKSGVSS